MNFREKHLRLSTFAFLMFFVSACSTVKGPSVANSPANDDSPQTLKQQILGLQKTQSSQSAKIDELNNKILVLNDQVKGSAPVAQASPPENQAAVSTPGSAPQPTPTFIPLPQKSKVNPLIPVAAPERAEPKSKAALSPVEKLYRQTVIDTKNQKLNAANKDVGLMLKNYRNSPLTNNALFLYAETLYERADYTKSAQEFERLYKLFPDGNKAVAALYKLALSYQKLGHPSEAQEAFENIVTVYPGSREALDAQNQIMNGQASPGTGQ